MSKKSQPKAKVNQGD